MRILKIISFSAIIFFILCGCAPKDLKKYSANLAVNSGGNPFALAASGLSYAAGAV